MTGEPVALGLPGRKPARLGPSAAGTIGQTTASTLQGSTPTPATQEWEQAWESTGRSAGAHPAAELNTGAPVKAPTTPEQPDDLRSAPTVPATRAEADLAELTRNSPFLDLDSPMTPYEWLKAVLMVPMMLLRAVLVALIVPPVWLTIHLLTAGTALNEPLSPWRRGILRPLLRFWADILMRIGFGFWRFRVTGWEHIPAAEACRALIVFNHVSYVDGIALVSIFLPSGLANTSVAQMPFVGALTKALSFLFVRRRGSNDAALRAGECVSTGSTTELMHARAADPRYPLFIVAPEGTTKPGHCLLTFSTGAFVAGAPVLPVLLKYRPRRFNPGWGRVSTAWHFFRIQTQFCNELDIEIMPPYRPSAEERARPRLYADNVRTAMGAALGAPLSSHGIVQQQALKRAGVQVDWTGRRIIQCASSRRPAKAGSPKDALLGK